MTVRRRRPRTAIATSTTAHESPKAISFGKPCGDSLWTPAWIRLTHRERVATPEVQERLVHVEEDRTRNGGKCCRAGLSTHCSRCGYGRHEAQQTIPLRVAKEELPAVRGRVSQPQ